MPCSCVTHQIKYRCGCILRSPNPRSSFCGQSTDGGSRKRACLGSPVHIVCTGDYCPKPLCQLRRFRGGRWRCCRCGTDNQAQDHRGQRCHCFHQCCKDCTQVTSRETSSSSNRSRSSNQMSDSSFSGRARASSPETSSASSVPLIHNTMVCTDMGIVVTFIISNPEIDTVIYRMSHGKLLD